MPAAAQHRDDGPIVAAVLARFSTRSSQPARLRWLVSPALRAIEYVVVLWAAWAAGRPTAFMAAFAFIAAVAFHHYEGAHRRQFWHQPIPRWVDRLGLGWDGRVIVIVTAAVADAAVPALVFLALWCGVLFVGETVVWVARATIRGESPPGVARTEHRLR